MRTDKHADGRSFKSKVQRSAFHRESNAMPLTGSCFDNNATVLRTQTADEEFVFCIGLTFELSGRQRQDAKPGMAIMYRVPPDRAWWPAVGAPLERVVRPRLHGW